MCSLFRALTDLDLARASVRDEAYRRPYAFRSRPAPPWPLQGALRILLPTPRILLPPPHSPPLSRIILPSPAFSSPPATRAPARGGRRWEDETLDPYPYPLSHIPPLSRGVPLRGGRYWELSEDETRDLEMQAKLTM
jgi:hypothetical protein